MADFAALQSKYAPVVDQIKAFEPYGAKFVGSELVGEQYHLVATLGSQVELNRVWDVIKGIDPSFADLKHELSNTGGQDQEYTINSGDTLSAVSKMFYGSANHYMAIAKASGMEDANNVQVGKTVTVPVIT